MRQDVKIYEGGTYELSGWFRIDKGSPEPYIYVENQDSGKTYNAKLAGSGDGFRRLKLEVKLPARNVKPIKVGWGITGSGSVTLDDVGFVAVQPRVSP